MDGAEQGLNDIGEEFRSVEYGKKRSWMFRTRAQRFRDLDGQGREAGDECRMKLRNGIVVVISMNENSPASEEETISLLLAAELRSM